jgi:hypothetical protein
VIASHFRLLVGSFGDVPVLSRRRRAADELPADAGGPYAEFELGGDKYLGLFDRGSTLEAVGRRADSERTSRRLGDLGVELEEPPADHEP